MENTSTTYDTLTGALEQLKAKGYTHDFSIRTDGDCLVCNSVSVSLSPDDFTIDEVIRFEERTLFSHLQSVLTDEALTALAGSHTEQNEDADSKWNDPFWTNK